MPAEKDLDPSASINHYIGDRVREARKQREWSQSELAKKVFSSTTSVSDAERGEGLDRDLAQKLEVVLALGEDSLTNLLKIRDGEAFRDYAKDFLKDQGRAQTIHEFSLVIPGLLQTPEYARAIMTLADPEETSDLDGDVQRRVERQQVFGREAPPWHWVVLEESALARVMGSKEIMRAQIEKLLEAIAKPHINVQILRSVKTSVPGSISLLTLPDGKRTAYSEGFVTGRYFVEPNDVDGWQRIYDRVRAEALGTGESTEIIQEALRKHT